MMQAFWFLAGFSVGVPLAVVLLARRRSRSGYQPAPWPGERDAAILPPPPPRPVMKCGGHKDPPTTPRPKVTPIGDKP